MEVLNKSSELFNDCSGYRARPCLDGSFPSYSTLKFFAMPRSIRSMLKKTIDDIDKNIETYFLKFGKDDKLPMVKGPSESFYAAESTLLSGEAVIKYKGEKIHMKSGDQINMDLRIPHSVMPVKESIFLVELIIHEDFLKC